MWDEHCARIFSEYVEKLNKENIRYFVLRNYHGLPEVNTSKDVDIIIEPGYLEKALKSMMDVYKDNNCKYYYRQDLARLHCMHGMSLTDRFGIHIDIIEGYLSKGYEIFTFDELYEHTTWYKGFCVMDDYFEGFMIFIYKQFGYKKIKLKDSYKEAIVASYSLYKDHFTKDLAKLTSESYAKQMGEAIEKRDFDVIISKAPEMTKMLRRYATRKAPVKTLINYVKFIKQKIFIYTINRKKLEKTFAILAPDGTGKTTFLDALLEKIDYYYVNNPDDMRCHVYHFRPNIFPNLGAVGEKTMKIEQDVDFTNPHRAKAANPVSSFVRMLYYMLDYILGWFLCVGNDVKFDRFSVFDRYSYDFIVDPGRIRINLPLWIRKALVALTPKPKTVFLLKASPEVIYSRKQELTLEEIREQSERYDALVKNKRFVIIDAEQSPEKMAEDAIEIILNRYAYKI